MNRENHMRQTLLVVAALGALSVSGTLFAQNFGADPLYGTLTLNTGFMPDPRSVEVQAGGADDVATLGITDPTGGTCTGMIAAAQPDVRVHYTAGTTFPLRFYVQSTADTTLLVNLPDATWRCNDDTVGLNPVIQIDSPPSGRYDIWIGTFRTGTPQAATLNVTELSSNGPTL
jgi:hypothetical protein